MRKEKREDIIIIIIIGLIKPPNGLLILAIIIFYYNGEVIRDRCIVVGEEVWMRYTILKVGVDKEEVSSVV